MTTMAVSNAGFLPTISVKRPVKGVMTVCERRYEVPTQEYWDEVAVKSAEIIGKAVEMILAVRLGSGSATGLSQCCPRPI